MKNKLEVTNIAKELEKFSDLWSQKIIAECNDNYVKVVKFKGKYAWHKHDNEDELFIIISGELRMDIPGKSLYLKPGEFVVMPKGIEHRPVAQEEVSILLIEPKTTLSTGDPEFAGKKPSNGAWLCCQLQEPSCQVEEL